MTAKRASEEIIAEMRPSAPRRAFALAVLWLLGVLLIWFAFSNPAAIPWRLFLVAAGLFTLWAAERMRRATALSLTLTTDALSDSSGRVLARMEDIAAMDRGVFAFKPSNGFVLRIRTPERAAWQPGVWWRLGRRVGVGGVMPASQTKAMAEAISLKLAQEGRG